MGVRCFRRGSFIRASPIARGVQILFTWALATQVDVSIEFGANTGLRPQEPEPDSRLRSSSTTYTHDVTLLCLFLHLLSGNTVTSKYLPHRDTIKIK